MPTSLQRPLVIAHRGLSARAPENTLAAFSLAIADGTDGLEFDVRLARDGVPVVIHDEDLFRTAGRRERVSDLSSAELAEINVGSWFNKSFPELSRKEFARQTIKTLAETLMYLESFRGRVYIELKCGARDTSALAAAVGREIARKANFGEVVIKSFELKALPLVKNLVPGVRTAALFKPTLATVVRKRTSIIKTALRFGADEISIHKSLATRRLVRLAHEQRLPVTVWTADDRRTILRLKHLGVRAVITNDPASTAALI